MKDLERENQQLRRAISNLTLDAKVQRSPGLARRIDGAIDGSGDINRQDRLYISSLGAGLGPLLGNIRVLSGVTWIRSMSICGRLSEIKTGLKLISDVASLLAKGVEVAMHPPSLGRERALRQ